MRIVIRIIAAKGNVVCDFRNNRFGLRSAIGSGQGSQQGRCIERNCRDSSQNGRIHHNLHDGARVGAVTRQGAISATTSGLIRCAGEVVNALIIERERCRCVVVKNQGLTGVSREVNNCIGTLGGTHQQAVTIDVGNRHAAAIGFISYRLRGNIHRIGQEAAIATNCNEVRTNRSRIRRASGTTICRPGTGGTGESVA